MICILVMKCLLAGCALDYVPEPDVVLSTICTHVMSRGTATDTSELDMLLCREQTRTVGKVTVASGNQPRVLTNATPVDCGVSDTSGRFASLLLPSAVKPFR